MQVGKAKGAGSERGDTPPKESSKKSALSNASLPFAHLFFLLHGSRVLDWYESLSDILSRGVDRKG